MLTKQHLDQLGANLLKLGVRRLSLLAVVGLGVLMTVMLAAHYLGRPAMQAIYTGLTPQDVTRMTTALAEAGIAFDVNEARNTVLVGFGQTARARTLLAQKGLPTSVRAGYELFDHMGSIGLTSFMQEVTRVRALEGEIARTIQALDGVAAARVHLVVPDSGSFRRERRDASASVLLKIDGRWHATAGQTVRHMVAAAVPGMKIEQVSVASTDGRLIAAAGEESNLGSSKLAELERSMAVDLEQRAGRTVASALGAGNFQISVTVRLDVDRQQTNETAFDPKSRVERSVRSVKQSGSTEDSAGKSAVGVEANLPREEGSPVDGDKRRTREDRQEELTNYELNSKTVQTVREGYRVQRLAIAVVVNRKTLAAQLGSDADATAIAARLAEVKRLVAAATGAVPERDDSIEVSATDFGSVGTDLAPTRVGFGDYLALHAGALINGFAMLAVVVVVVWFGMRPLIRALGHSERGGERAPPSLAALADAAGPSPQPPLVLASPSANATDSTHRRDAAPPKSPEAQSRDRLDALVEQNDAKVAKILKTWVSEVARA